ncbi:MAG: 3'(2'),5'-bisphosphate nucleotidase CysQ [Bacteroidales bacterium]|nr:3'(2'),5'-bisphosphate nucleotidase CysQ [Bacteroidales bacterium]
MILSGELKIAIQAAIDAGKATLQYYGKPMQITNKSDYSPLTQADIEADRIIACRLAVTQIPVLSEESKSIAYSERKQWKQYWLVDPLDGTKEFINNSNEYTVNIALMLNNKPVAGIIYVPAKDTLYYGRAGEGAYKLEKAGTLAEDILFKPGVYMPLPGNTTTDLVVIASRSHPDPNTLSFIKNIESSYNQVSIENYGSSLKFCMLAEGKADIYPRLGPTMEWDIAAGHAIIEAAGINIVQYKTKTPLVFNKENLLNPWFVAFGKKFVF